ncbi:hypothetical protein ACRRTK_017862 [Alexandromys fortis]
MPRAPLGAQLCPLSFQPAENVAFFKQPFRRPRLEPCAPTGPGRSVQPPPRAQRDAPHRLGGGAGLARWRRPRPTPAQSEGGAAARDTRTVHSVLFRGPWRVGGVGHHARPVLSRYKLSPDS